MANFIYCPGCFSPKEVGVPCESCSSPKDAVAALSEAIEKYGPHTACKRCGGVWRGVLPSCPSCDRPQFKPLVPLEVETLRRLPPAMAKEMSVAFRFGPQTPPPGTYYGVVSDGLGDGEEEEVVPGELPRAVLRSQDSWIRKLKHLLGL